MNFLTKILNHYKFVNKKTQIFVSTWKDERAQNFAEIFKDETNIKFVLNDLPTNPGPSNINLQIASTRGGLNSILSEGYTYVVKTRTDQCMFNPRAVENLLALYEHHNKGSGNKIVVNALNTFLFRLYGASDMLQFGNIEDLVKYWDAPQDPRTAVEESILKSAPTLRNYAKHNVGETYLGIHYLRSLGLQPNFSLKQSLDNISHNFIVADNDVTNTLWHKYSRQINRWPSRGELIPFQQIDYSTWLALNSGKLSFNEYEYLLDQEISNGFFKAV